jgi:predicted NBD/HSP70 family sugar kinase
MKPSNPTAPATRPPHPQAATRRINLATFQVARQGTSRQINRQIALNLVREKQPLSRADLARLLGMRRGPVSRIVGELIEAGLLFEGAKGESATRGRRPTHLYIETRKRCALAVDITASHTSVLMTDLLGHPLTEVEAYPTPPDPRAFVKDLSKRIGRILATNRDLGKCAGIGMVVAGMVDRDGTRLLHAPTLEWRNVDLVTPLAAASRLPIVIENDVKACILAQVWAVTGDRPVEGPIVFVEVSDGVGVGIAIDGKLLRGSNNIAGEFGHVPLNMYGPLCACGQRGCWEAYVSTRATTTRYLGTDPSWTGTSEPPGPTVAEIVKRARAGEGRALEALRETAYYMARGFATIVKTIDPGCIYLGGEITAAWDLISSTVREGMREQALVKAADETEIRIVPLSEYPRLRGAAALVSTPAFAAPTVA